MHVKSLMFVLLFVALCTTRSVEAQTVYGFRIGASVGTLSGTFASGSEPVSTTGLVAGSFVRYALRNDFGVQVEALYSQKGARFGAVTDEGTPFERTLQLTYLEVPLLVTFAPLPHAPLRPLLYAGGAIGFEIGEQIRERLDDFSQTQGSDDLVSPDFGLMLRADVQLPLGTLDALLGVRYTLGLRDLSRPDAGAGAQAYTRTFALTVGFYF